MKRSMIIGTVAVLALLVGGSMLFAHGPGGGYGYGRGDGWYCPMWGDSGWHMGPGMMGPGWHRGYDPDDRPGYGSVRKPIDQDEAKAILERYLASRNNPNLKLGKIEDKGDIFEAEIVTKDDSLVDRLLVDKRTGWVRSIY